MQPINMFSFPHRSFNHALLSRGSSRLSLGRPATSHTSILGGADADHDHDDHLKGSHMMHGPSSGGSPARSGGVPSNLQRLFHAATRPPVRPAIQQVMEELGQTGVTLAEDHTLDRSTAPSSVTGSVTRLNELDVGGYRQLRAVAAVGSPSSPLGRRPNSAHHFTTPVIFPPKQSPPTVQAAPQAVQVMGEAAPAAMAQPVPLAVQAVHAAHAAFSSTTGRDRSALHGQHAAMDLDEEAGPSAPMAPSTSMATSAPPTVPARPGPSPHPPPAPGNEIVRLDDEILVLEEPKGPVRRNYPTAPVPPDSAAAAAAVAGVLGGASKRGRRASMEMRGPAVIQRLREMAGSDDDEDGLVLQSPPVLGPSPVPQQPPPVLLQPPLCALQPPGRAAPAVTPNRARHAVLRLGGDEDHQEEWKGEEGGGMHTQQLAHQTSPFPEERPSRLSPFVITAHHAAVGGALAVAFGSSGGRGRMAAAATAATASAPGGPHPPGSADASFSRIGGPVSPSYEEAVRKVGPQMARRTVDVMEWGRLMGSSLDGAPGSSGSSSGGAGHRRGGPLVFTNALFNDEGEEGGVLQGGGA